MSERRRGRQVVTSAYYNEIDHYAAQWLRNLIAAGHIAPGDVDERDIRDVWPDDIRKYTQCHFFAGIGVWSYALRLAGWPDDRPVWTGSCPCQPFSAAGLAAGFADERHLWPSFYHLISQCNPDDILGEQVASKNADPWVDLVQTDLEALGYAFGAVAFPSASVGAPHIRDRDFWVAYSPSERRERSSKNGRETQRGIEHAGEIVGLAHTDGARHEGGGLQQVQIGRHCEGALSSFDGLLPVSRLGDDDRARLEGLAGHGDAGAGRPQPTGSVIAPGAVNGFWADADWLFCRDGKWRPVEPGTFPLANGAPARVGRLRAYGNAINAENAREFIAAYMECRP